MKTHFVHFQVTLQTSSEEGNLYKEGKVNERTMKEKKNPVTPFCYILTQKVRAMLLEQDNCRECHPQGEE